MARLTDAEWADQKAPFCYIDIAAPEYWMKVHYEMVAKWIDANAQGWWYWDGSLNSKKKTYVFERNADRVLFKLWISDDPFQREGGEIERMAAELVKVNGDGG